MYQIFLFFKQPKKCLSFAFYNSSRHSPDRNWKERSPGCKNNSLATENEMNASLSISLFSFRAFDLRLMIALHLHIWINLCVLTELQFLHAYPGFA